MSELTREVPAPGLVVWQPRRGYRYGVEVYLLADFALRGGGGRVVDLGCGSGVVGLLMAAAGCPTTLVDRDPRWLSVARRNVSESAVEGAVVDADVRALEGAWDLAVSNPPWFEPDEPIPPDPWKAVSRAMLHGRVADFVAAGLRVAPRVCVVTRVERRAELAHPDGHVARLARHGDKLLLAELRRGAGTLREEGVDVDAAYARWRG